LRVGMGVGEHECQTAAQTRPMPRSSLDPIWERYRKGSFGTRGGGYLISFPFILILLHVICSWAYNRA
jgi:hypothetical protein